MARRAARAPSTAPSRLTVLVPMLVGVHPRMASERAGPASTAVLEPPGSPGPQLRHPDAPGDPRRPPRLRHRPGSPPGCPVRPAPRRGPRSRTTGCSATPARPRWSAPTVRRLAVHPSLRWSACVRPAGRRSGRGHASDLGPGTPPRSSPAATAPSTATLETTWQTDSGRLTLTEGMVAEVGGRLLPATMLVRRLTAPDGPVEAVIDFDPRLGRAAPITASRAPR